MTFVHFVCLGVGIAVWVAVKACEWYVERGRYEIQAIRRSRRRPDSQDSALPAAAAKGHKDTGAVTGDEFIALLRSSRADLSSPSNSLCHEQPARALPRRFDNIPFEDRAMDSSE
jgi:hypothetical protein